MDPSEAAPSTSAEQQLAALVEVGARLDSDGFDHWLFGGRAVDFPVGAVTRLHGDIDLAVWSEDAGAIHSSLGVIGWQHRPAADEDGGTGYERDGVRLELTYLASGESGEVSSLSVIRTSFGRSAHWVARSSNSTARALGSSRSSCCGRGKSRPRADPNEAEIDQADFDAISRLGT